jgi:hypothetical protein
MKSWKYIVGAGVLATLVGAGSSFAQATEQPPSRQQKTPVTFEQNPKFSDENAGRTKENFERLLETQPPSLRRVLQLDPSLLTNPAYLAPYSQLGEFLQQHPEIAHNPTFFLGSPEYAEIYIGNRRRENGQAMEALTFLFIFLVIGGTIVWVVKAFVDHRRWLRLSRLQTEANSKLMERFGTTEELLNFIQSPAGSRLMESSVVPVEPRAVGAPVNRILWSTQIGLVLLAIGAGLEFASRRGIDTDSASVFDSLGILIIAAGVGFVASGLLSYMLSQKLGLLEALRVSPTSGGGSAPKPS